MFPIRLAFSSRFLRPAPAGEKLLFSAGHHIQLAPVALHPDAGRCLAGLDLLLTCSRMPYVSQPCGNPFFCQVRFPTLGPPFLSLLSPCVGGGLGTCPEACLREVFQGRWDGRWAPHLTLRAAVESGAPQWTCMAPRGRQAGGCLRLFVGTHITSVHPPAPKSGG